MPRGLTVCTLGLTVCTLADIAVGILSFFMKITKKSIVLKRRKTY